MNATAHPEIFEDVINHELLFNVDLRRNRITVEFKGKHVIHNYDELITIGQYYEFKKKTIKELTEHNFN